MITTLLKGYKNRVETKLKQYLPNEKNNLLHEAMQYSVLNGGKRIRPALIYMVGDLLNANISALDIPACAIEVMHSFSLIHDDLPGMDNDNLRRGKPTCHKQFDEAIAILAGDSLLTLCFEILTTKTPYLSPLQQNEMIATTTKASGANGMALGQALDMKNNKNTTITDLNTVQQLKTGALLEASVELAFITANCADEKIKTELGKYAQCIGLGFQIRDDIIGIESSTEKLGKTAGVDIKNEKITFPFLLGIEKSKQRCEQLHQQAISHLHNIHFENSPLAELSRFIISREY